ncbi:hypothetical protein EWB00_001356, partial [Schistosoma japonicum]
MSALHHRYLIDRYINNQRDFGLKARMDWSQRVNCAVQGLPNSVNVFLLMWSRFPCDPVEEE